MNRILKNHRTTSESKKIIINFNSLYAILKDIFSITIDKKTDKKQTPKLLKQHIDSLKNLSSNTSLTPKQLDEISTLIFDLDPELKVFSNFVIESSQCHRPEIKKLVNSVSSHTVSSKTFINPFKENDIFLSIYTSIASDGSQDRLPYLISTLETRFTVHLNDISKQQKELSKEEKLVKNLISAREIKGLKLNVLTLAHLWSLEYGNADFENVAHHLSKLCINSYHDASGPNDRPIYEDKDQQSSVIYYLASQVSTSPHHNAASTLAYFKSKLEDSKSKKSNAVRRGDSLEINFQDEKKKTVKLELQLQQKDKEIELLHNEIRNLKQTAETNEMSAIVQNVHLRDNTDRVRSKAFNLLMEDVLPPLQISLKVLDREQPKTHIATHHIDLMIEKIEEALEWFKNTK